MKENVQPRGGEETRPKAATNEEARFQYEKIELWVRVRRGKLDDVKRKVKVNKDGREWVREEQKKKIRREKE